MKFSKDSALLSAIFLSLISCTQNMSDSLPHSSHSVASYGDGCSKISISVAPENKTEDTVSVNSVDFCQSLSVGEARRLSEKIKNTLTKDSKVVVRVQCDGVDGANKFLLVHELLVGYRKICSNVGNTCRTMLKYQSDSMWHNDGEIYSRACDEIIR